MKRKPVIRSQFLFFQCQRAETFDVPETAVSGQITALLPLFRFARHRIKAVAVSIETERKLTAAEAKEILKNAPGVVLQDDMANKVYPMPLLSSDTDLVYVGRVREDISCDNGLCLWVVADQIRKGAATNAVQIAELLVKEELV